MIVKDIDKHHSMLEKNIDTMISQAEKTRRLAEENKDRILNKRPTYVA